MTLEEYKIKNNLSYYTLGQQLGCESINPAVIGAEIFAFNVFHGDENKIIKTMKIEHTDNIRMDKPTRIAALIF